MPRSLARVVLHGVFSTKNRGPFLIDPELRARLHASMAGILQNIGCEPILIKGVEDQVHLQHSEDRTHRRVSGEGDDGAVEMDERTRGG